MSFRPLPIISAGIVAVLAAVAFALAAASPVSADTGERTLNLTRQDGSPIGTLFEDWTMVPGDVVSTTVVAHRAGGGASSLLITLGDDADATPTPVEEDVVITVAANGVEHSASASALSRGEVVFDLGRSSAAVVPIDVTFELPFSSGNDTQRQSLALGIVVTAVDPTGPASTDPAGGVDGEDVLAVPAFPNLATTGASIRDLLIGVAVVTAMGLLLLGSRRRRDERGDAR